MSIVERLKRVTPIEIKSVLKIMGDPAGKRRLQTLAHSYDRTPVVPHLIVPDLKADDKDVNNAERLLRAYGLAIQEYKSLAADFWTFLAHRQKHFFSLLQANDPVQLAQYLCNMNKEEATIGTVQGNLEYKVITRDPKYRKFLALVAKDKLVSLAEAIGILPVENAENGQFGKSLYLDANELVKKISSAVGFDITPPPIDGGLLKMIVGDALISERDCTAIYTAYLMRSAGSICEIGGGAGRVAYWSARFGVSNYTIIDLPHINVIQGFYLLKTLPESVSLFGEPEKAIKIVPCNALPEGKYDLIMNQDSFPEIGKATVLSYLQWIRKHTAEFLSINHESKAPYPDGEHIRVAELIMEIDGFTRLQRYPYWLRRGYVTEWYRVIH